VKELLASSDYAHWHGLLRQIDQYQLRIEQEAIKTGYVE
jgi:hypothetical protein